MKATICAYQGNFVMVICISWPTSSPGAAARSHQRPANRFERSWKVRGLARLLECGLDAELHELAWGRRHRLGPAADNLDRLLEVAGSFEVAHEIGQARQRRAQSVDDDV